MRKIVIICLSALLFLSVPLQVYAYYSGRIFWTLSYSRSEHLAWRSDVTKFLTSKLLAEGMEVGKLYDVSFTPEVAKVTKLKSFGVDFWGVSLKSLTLTTPGGGQSFPLEPDTVNDMTLLYDAAGSFKIDAIFEVYASWDGGAEAGSSSNTVCNLDVSWDLQFSNVIVELLERKSDNEALNSIDKEIQKGNKQQADRWEKEDTEASQQGSDITGAVTEIQDTVKSKWEILWYPITFTNDLISVFSGGSAAYARSYGNVTGYTYDESTGLLEPVYDLSRAAPRAGGASITFPGLSLPGIGQVWDSYTYDLSVVKSQLPAVFDAIYVVTTVLELYWFVGFLRDKYEEVFG